MNQNGLVAIGFESSQGRFVAVVAEWSRYRIVAGLVTSPSPVPLKTRHPRAPPGVDSNNGAPDLQRDRNLLSNIWGVALKNLLALVKIK
ncbi:hypothetical protein TNCV_1407861 [Trichonephila clavipes]|nr:hypothetical protein TNCV_1407861 [Trichonephila clavipes]